MKSSEICSLVLHWHYVCSFYDIKNEAVALGLEGQEKVKQQTPRGSRATKRTHASN